MMGLSGTDNCTVRQHSTAEDAKTTSMNDYAHLTGHLQMKADQLGTGSAQSTVGMEVAEDEQLSKDLTLFMENMRKIDVDRQK